MASLRACGLWWTWAGEMLPLGGNLASKAKLPSESTEEAQCSSPPTSIPFCTSDSVSMARACDFGMADARWVWPGQGAVDRGWPTAGFRMTTAGRFEPIRHRRHVGFN